MNKVLLAALLARKVDFGGQPVVVVASGGNVDPDMFIRALGMPPQETGSGVVPPPPR